MRKKQFRIQTNHAVMILLSLLGVWSCSRSSHTKMLSNSPEEQVKATLIEMWDAIEKEDIDRYAQYVHPDFTQFGETDPVLREGKEAEIAGINAWIKESDNIHTEMIDPKVTIEGNVAWITYYWSDHVTTNGEKFSSKGKSTRIFVKENNKWLCIHGHYTLLP